MSRLKVFLELVERLGSGLFESELTHHVLVHVHHGNTAHVREGIHLTINIKVVGLPHLEVCIIHFCGGHVGLQVERRGGASETVSHADLIHKHVRECVGQCCRIDLLLGFHVIALVVGGDVNVELLTTTLVEHVNEFLVDVFNRCGPELELDGLFAGLVGVGSGIRIGCGATRE